MVPSPAVAAPLRVEFLSAHPELLFDHNQAWGELGFDTAAHVAQNVGDPLRIGSQVYTNGLGHHAVGRVMVLLGGEFEQFEAEVGLQPCPGGSVCFRVSADGKLLFDSGVLRSGEEAKPVNVSVAGAQELVLEAIDGGDGITCDMANWANARLTRSTTARIGSLGTVLDIAPFAAAVTSNPGRTNGAKATRLEEYLAEDVFLETGLDANSDGGYTLTPDTNGIACFGLNWFAKRPLRELRLRLADPTTIPAPEQVKVQAWFGESSWQGAWLPLDGVVTIDAEELVVRLSTRSPLGGLLQTRKVRWLLANQEKSLKVRQARAFTSTGCGELTLVVEAESSSAAHGQVRICNGELLARGDLASVTATGWNDWELVRPLQLKLRYFRPSSFKADATLLQFRLPAGGVAVSIADLLASNSIYVPSRGLFVTLKTNAASAPSLAEYRRRISGRKSVLDDVHSMPDQTFSQAMARTHHDAQDEGPVMLSLACDNTKFVVERGGEVAFPSRAATGDDWFSGAGDLRPIFGDGRRDRSSRVLDGGWLPIPVITVEREGVRYVERVFVAPTDEAGLNPARLNRRSMCVADFTVENLRDQTNSARLALGLRLAGKPRVSAVLQRQTEGRFTAQAGQMQATLTCEDRGPLKVSVEGGTLTFSGTLPPRGIGRCAVFLADKLESQLGQNDVATARKSVEAYWRAVLADGTQIETPDALLNSVIRSSQVRCFIAARNEADASRIAPWIAAMSYGPLESEAHAVIRGMDFLGHHDFARRGFEYFIHRYNTNGFLTTGYTTFGTAWHLWTLGEHYELTGDQAWLKEQAPELARVGDWILRQTGKTRRLGADGQPVAEFGLMPPAVMADWNSFAYHFMLNGYYFAALNQLAEGLRSIGDPRAAVYAAGAQDLRTNILRAYRWTQAQSPALPLRDGSWIPLYPSQVHSPGKLADFFPGDDAGRSWAYDTELGAHQLVPTGVFAPDDPEVSRMLDHLEDVQFLGEGWFDYPAAENARDWFNLGGFAKVQPYYGRNAEIYAMRHEVKPFLRSYFNSLASLLNTEVLTLWEHFRHSGAWDKTHETGYFLHQTRLMLVQEMGNDLWLAPLIPEQWLTNGKELAVKNAPTHFGPVSFTAASAIDSGVIRLMIVPPTRSAPDRLVLWLRHPGSHPIRSVEVNKRNHLGFDARLQTVSLKPERGPMTVIVRF
jgi:hypothetical protein